MNERREHRRDRRDRPDDDRFYWDPAPDPPVEPDHDGARLEDRER